jgi:hypothetical protein
MEGLLENDTRRTMKEFDWPSARRDKDALREGNAGKSFADKLRQLDRLRERAEAMKGAKPLGSSRPGVRTGTAGARRKK